MQIINPRAMPQISVATVNFQRTINVEFFSFLRRCRSAAFEAQILAARWDLPPSFLRSEPSQERNKAYLFESGCYQMFDRG